MSQNTEIKRNGCHQLLMGLKTTVEGLLATPSSNVWNRYGGLPRLLRDVEAIMNHGLKVVQGKHGSSLDYWNFVRGLRWLNPIMAPSIEQFHKMTRGDKSLQPGQAWLKQSLLDHRLSTQLLILVSNQQHLHRHYNRNEAFLSNPEFFHAMVICLQAVEHNKAALLAEIDPGLLLGRMSWQKLSAGKSISLPCVSSPSDSIMIRRTNTHDRLAPPIISPKLNAEHPQFELSGEHASPVAGSSSPDESAKVALLHVLGRSAADYDEEHHSFYKSIERSSDPLMNMEVASNTTLRLPPRMSDSASSLADVTVNSIPNRRTGRERVKRQSEEKSDRSRVKKQSEEKNDRRTSQRTGQQLDRILNNEGEDFQPMDSTDNSTTVILQKEKDSVVGGKSINETVVQKDSLKNPGSVGAKKSHHIRSKSDMGVSSIRVLPGGDAPKYSTSASQHKQSSDSAKRKRHEVDKKVKSEMGLREGYFPQPTKGQTLMNYLSSQDFHTCAELDKENAHFSISEALIAAIEQMKWNQVIRPPQSSDVEEGDSDEEIQQLKQRIRIRRRERMKEKAKTFPAYTSDGRTDTATTTTTESTSPSSSLLSSDESQGSSSDSEEIHDTEISQSEDMADSGVTNLTSLKESGLSLSMASLYSDADLQKSNQIMEKSLERQMAGSEPHTTRITSMEFAASHNSMHSAESVAISLLKKFSEKHLPKASELVWMVSEQDAPQALLPLPDSFPISPDDNENSDIATTQMRTRLRGNLEWAPPRPQIVFNIHPPPKRKVLLAKQNYRCAGCGTKVESGYMKRYRYCEYLGKYFCPCCHTNEMSYIPGRILRKWDFRKYHVSNFARDLLNRISNDPLFNIEDINPGLYKKVRVLEQIKECRLQLQQIKMFLQTCRLGLSLLGHFDQCPQHWFSEPKVHTLNELVRVKNSEILPFLRTLVTKCMLHINQCPLCQAKGFICEVCKNGKDILFPYQLQRVKLCQDCKTCYHSACYVPGKCSKCARIEARKHALESQLAKDSSDESS